VILRAGTLTVANASPAGAGDSFPSLITCNGELNLRTGPIQLAPKAVTPDRLAVRGSLGDSVTGAEPYFGGIRMPPSTRIVSAFM
jgi:hypothetical protein